MTSDRIKEIQETTAYPESISVKQALLQVWNECQQEYNRQSKQKIIDFIKWIDEEEVPYEDGRWIQYFNEKDNYLTFEELYDRYLLHTGAQAGN